MPALEVAHITWDVTQKFVQIPVALLVYDTQAHFIVIIGTVKNIMKPVIFQEVESKKVSLKPYLNLDYDP